MSEETQVGRAQLLSLLTKRAEERASFVWFGGRTVHRGDVPWPQLAASIAAYPVEHADMLRARSVHGAASVELLDIALRCDLGRGRRGATGRTARARLRDVFRVVAAMHCLGEGLRFGELLAATGIGETRLAKVLRFGVRAGAFTAAGEYGWFLGGSGLAEVYQERVKAQEGRQ
jgi:hypothetical protein